jgi:hypothetical protein
MLKFGSLLIAASLVVACSTPAEPSKPAGAAPAPKQEVKAQAEPVKEQAQVGPKLYGEAFADDIPVVALETLLKTPKAYLTNAARVTGHVRKACTKKGCWMELSTTPDPKAPGCRVTFKDYGFFVPLDSAGSTAQLVGTAKLEIVSKDHVDHLEAEGATFANKNADGTATEVQIVATGVELTL